MLHLLPCLLWVLFTVAQASQLRQWFHNQHKLKSVVPASCSLIEEAPHNNLCDEVLQLLFDVEVGADMRFSDGQDPLTALEFAIGMHEGRWPVGEEPFYPFYDMRDAKPTKRVCASLTSLPEYARKCCSILHILCGDSSGGTETVPLTKPPAAVTKKPGKVISKTTAPTPTADSQQSSSSSMEPTTTADPDTVLMENIMKWMG